MKRATLPALLACVLLAPAYAGDEGIYGAAPPPSSAFIRVFNATPDLVAGARIAHRTFADVPPYGASEFAFLPAGSHTLHIGGRSEPLNLARNRYHTAVHHGGGVRLVDVAGFDNRLKALVVLYNLTDSPGISLKTADGRTGVVEPVGPAGAGSREVNAVRVKLALYDGATKVADVKPVNLQRGKAFSLFVTGPGESPMPVWVVN